MRRLVACSAFALCCTPVGAARAYQPIVNFQLHCMGCHLRDGSGEAGRVPSIRRSLAIFSMSPQGRDYVIRVPGIAQSPLSDEDMAALLNWMVRNLSDVKVSDGFTDYSAAEVRHARLRPLAQVTALRARLLNSAAPRGAVTDPR